MRSFDDRFYNRKVKCGNMILTIKKPTEGLYNNNLDSEYYLMQCTMRGITFSNLITRKDFKEKIKTKYYEIVRE